MSNLGYRCEGHVGKTVITITRYDATIDDAWDKFNLQLESLADILETSDWEVIRVATVVNHKDA